MCARQVFCARSRAQTGGLPTGPLRHSTCMRRDWHLDERQRDEGDLSPPLLPLLLPCLLSSPSSGKGTKVRGEEERRRQGTAPPHTHTPPPSPLHLPPFPNPCQVDTAELLAHIQPQLIKCYTPQVHLIITTIAPPSLTPPSLTPPSLTPPAHILLPSPPLSAPLPTPAGQRRPVPSNAASRDESRGSHTQSAHRPVVCTLSTLNATLTPLCTVCVCYR